MADDGVDERPAHDGAVHAAPPAPAGPPAPPGPAGAGLAAYLLAALADPSRLAIVRHLAGGEHRVVDLTRHLGLAQSTVSQHLACLRGCGLVTSRAQGRASWFALAHPEATLDLLRAAERLLARTEDGAVGCLLSGTGAP